MVKSFSSPSLESLVCIFIPVEVYATGKNTALLCVSPYSGSLSIVMYALFGFMVARYLSHATFHSLSSLKTYAFCGTYMVLCDRLPTNPIASLASVTVGF